ncbi:hypothetical protein SAMN02745823_00013 [Sporobacter termitidis DSM 10068]|uniref:GIY-YIG nuclease family protein n=1 Tax=Sporobacter termitidis DSM 10068 TaxID=1123282 RepID=A0A1M5TAI2_9FIRM|nr:GIY-YIG nuclease family protein [Sporobacter termitidis]SHH47795.1 hypothetical protein SAMN02745823_00013 [Sporobacter termitidis DSM 10068]
MADKETKKQLISAYKERARTQAGGVYLIRNKENGRIFLDDAPDISAAENRFCFAQQTGSCVNIRLGKDWARYGGGAFEFEALETIDKNEDQTAAEFRDDLDVLKNMWLEKYDPAVLY